MRKSIQEIECIEYQGHFPNAFFHSYVDDMSVDMGTEEMKEFYEMCKRVHSLRYAQVNFLLDYKTVGMNEFEMSSIKEEIRILFRKMSIWSRLEFYTNCRLNK